MSNRIIIATGLLIIMLLSNGCETIKTRKSNQTQAMREMEQFITCNFFELNNSGEAVEQIAEFERQELVEQIGRSRGFQYRVVGELDLLGLQPDYIGHMYGSNMGPFARFEEDDKTVVSNIKARGTKLDKLESATGRIYFTGEKKGYWRLVVIPISRDVLEENCPPLPRSDVDSTLVQCVYQGP